VWFTDSRWPDGRASVTQIPPDVAVEIVTATPRDRVAKHDEYAAFGVRCYWLVDPELRTVEVFELRDGVYARVLGASEGAAWRGGRGAAQDGRGPTARRVTGRSLAVGVGSAGSPRTAVACARASDPRATAGTGRVVVVVVVVVGWPVSEEPADPPADA
jgi:hypothetical protein